MVQAAEVGGGDNLAGVGRINISGDRRVAIQRQVRPDGVVVINLLSQDIPQMILVEDDHVVEAFSTD